MRVGVSVTLGVLVIVGVWVGVCVDVGVSVGVRVVVWVTVGVCVGVPVGVDVGVDVGVCVGVLVGVDVGVSVGVLLGVSVGVRVGVAVAVLVAVPVTEALLVGVDDTVGVLVGVLVATAGVFVGPLTLIEPFAPVVPANNIPLISKALGAGFSNGYVPPAVVARIRKLQVISVPSPVSCVGVEKLSRPTRATLHGAMPGPVQLASVVQLCWPLLHTLPAERKSGAGAIAVLSVQSVAGLMLNRVLSNWMSFCVV